MSTGDPLVVFCLGPERWLQAEAVEGLRRRTLAAGFEEADLVRFSDPSTPPARILEAARTAPLGSSRRLILMEGLEELEPDSVPWLVPYLAQPSPSACVVLCAARLTGGKDWIPAHLQRSGRVRFVWCLPLKGRELEGWVLQRSRRAGKEIEPRGVGMLIQRVGSDLQNLALALESLSLLVGDAARITQADVERLFSPSVRETAFGILDAAAAGQTARAMQAVHEALGSGRITMDQLLGALGWTVRRGPVARMRRWPALRIREFLEELLRADVLVKQGHPAPELLAGQLLLELNRSS